MPLDRETIRRWQATYYPCQDGVHVFSPDTGDFGGATVKNFPGETLTVFRELSSAGADDDWDLLCDLFENGDMTDNVPIRRQDLEIIEREIAGREALRRLNTKGD